MVTTHKGGKHDRGNERKGERGSSDTNVQEPAPAAVLVPAAPAYTELELLEAQHKQDLERVEQIRAQLARAIK